MKNDYKKHIFCNLSLNFIILFTIIIIGLIIFDILHGKLRIEGFLIILFNISGYSYSKTDKMENLNKLIKNKIKL